MTQKKPRQSDRQSTKWSGRVRLLVSIVVVFHLLAVVMPPLAFQTSGPLGLSPSVATLVAPVEPYSQFTYMDRGYSFFAPDPGPSHLIQVGLTDGDGKLTEQMYPDLDHQWPRLLYHRHFMLSEYLNEIHQPPGPPAELEKSDPEAARSWRDRRRRYESVRKSIVHHLEKENPEFAVGIRRIEHLLPDLVTFREEAVSLTDPRSYQVLLDSPVDLESSEDLRPNQPSESVPSPESPRQNNSDDPPASSQQESGS